RSYALSDLPAGAFDLFPGVRSQVYGGVRAEQPETNAAVEATAGQVLSYGGAVAQTFFYSTSGGRTVSAEDAWGKPIPYLVSVPDPYDSISPYHDWGPVSFTAARLAKALKSPGRLLDVQTTPNGSGRVGTVTALGATGESTSPGVKVRTALGLRAAATDLRGLVRPVLAGARVDVQRLDGAVWRTVKQVQVDPNGDFDAPLQLTSGSYRARVVPGRGFVPGTTRVLEVVNG